MWVVWGWMLFGLSVGQRANLGCVEGTVLHGVQVWGGAVIWGAYVGMCYELSMGRGYNKGL